MITNIKNAKRAYIVALNEPRDGMGTHRFSIYLANDNGLEILWPEDSHNGEKAVLLNHQVYTKRANYPAFHFALSGCGYSKTDEIRRMLNKINPDLKVFTLFGYSPSPLN